VLLVYDAITNSANNVVHNPVLVNLVYEAGFGRSGPASAFTGNAAFHWRFVSVVNEGVPTSMRLLTTDTYPSGLAYTLDVWITQCPFSMV